MNITLPVRSGIVLTSKFFLHCKYEALEQYPVMRNGIRGAKQRVSVLEEMQNQQEFHVSTGEQGQV
jgi:hypothetical protein